MSKRTDRTNGKTFVVFVVAVAVSVLCLLMRVEIKLLLLSSYISSVMYHVVLKHFFNECLCIMPKCHFRQCQIFSLCKTAPYIFPVFTAVSGTVARESGKKKQPIVNLPRSSVFWHVLKQGTPEHPSKS